MSRKTRKLQFQRELAAAAQEKIPRREKYPRKVGGGGEHPGVWGQIIGAKISGRRYLMR